MIQSRRLASPRGSPLSPRDAVSRPPPRPPDQSYHRNLGHPCHCLARPALSPRILAMLPFPPFPPPPASTVSIPALSVQTYASPGSTAQVLSFRSFVIRRSVRTTRPQCCSSFPPVPVSTPLPRSLAVSSRAGLLADRHRSSICLGMFHVEPVLRIINNLRVLIHIRVDKPSFNPERLPLLSSRGHPPTDYPHPGYLRIASFMLSCICRCSSTSL
jgi:hypothetical protein